MGGMLELQKERFSRAFVVAAAASASDQFTYTLYADDIEGVDMTVRDRGVGIDFQLKATAEPLDREGHLIFDLDTVTYNKLVGPVRGNIAVLALIVIHRDPDQWVSICDESTILTHCAYYLPLTGMAQSTNMSTVRLRIPIVNRLTPAAISKLMSLARGRLVSS